MQECIRRTIIIGVCLVLGLLGSSLPSTPSESQGSPYEVVKNIVYYDGPGFNPKRHILDIYMPQGLKNAPVLIFVHGGGWTSGDKGLYWFIGHAFARREITTVVISYRLTPEVMHPGHIEDVARAFAWVYRNISKYGGNPEKIFVTGHSAGGHLTALLALDERYLEAHGLSTDLIRGAIPISGIYNLNTLRGYDAVFSSDPQKRRDASPVAHVGDKQPPFLIIYAENDFRTADAQAIELFNLLKQHSTKAELLKIPAKDHYTIIISIGQTSDPTTEAIMKFIRAHTLNR